VNKMNITWPGDRDKFFRQGSPSNPIVAVLGDLIKYRSCVAPLPETYKKAADIIVSYINDGKIVGHPDIYFFPIAYLYRHGIELYLKELVQHGIKLDILQKNKQLEKSMGDHKLYPLWNVVRIVLEEVWPDGDKNDLKNVERLIQEFHTIDPTGQTLRYLMDKTGKPTTEKLPHSVDLKLLRDTCNGLFNFLGGCEAGLSEAEAWQGDY